MLKMKSACEKCGASLPLDGTAYICSFECTFCETCTQAMDATCPNCEGELLRRPCRVRKALEVAATQLKQKLFGK